MKGGESTGMLAAERQLVAMVAEEMAAAVETAVSGWMDDIEEVLSSRLSDAGKLTAIQSIVNVCKREGCISGS